ncbi:GNAT family N-acetyltransferase [Micromonospora sp. NPDC048898]|uniref:GNAT family N-acetyltransferase n=1 Tax=Micromonospora sp. NPDC048898 TaxID=3364260 RepID=UPI0037121C81
MSVVSVKDLEPQLAANRRYWTGWAKADPDTDLPLYRTGIEHPLLNGLLRVRGRSLDEAAAQAHDSLDGSVWSWWVSSDSDAGTADGLIARGAELTGEMPVMAVDVDEAMRFDLPGDLEIRTVVDEHEMRQYVRAYSGPLGFRPEDEDSLVAHELNFGFPEVVRLAGVIDGRTVGTCTLSLGAEVAALYFVATDPEYRKRGIATALSVESLRLAREAGRRIVTLQASEEGARVYQRVGFETVGTYRTFKLPN